MFKDVGVVDLSELLRLPPLREDPATCHCSPMGASSSSSASPLSELGGLRPGKLSKSLSSISESQLSLSPLLSPLMKMILLVFSEIENWSESSKFKMGGIPPPAAGPNLGSNPPPEPLCRTRRPSVGEGSGAIVVDAP